MSNLQPAVVTCADTVGHPTAKEHPRVSIDGSLTAECEICRLTRHLVSSLNIMQECLDCLVDGKVVLAAKGLENWLELMGPTKPCTTQATEKEPK